METTSCLEGLAGNGTFSLLGFIETVSKTFRIKTIRNLGSKITVIGLMKTTCESPTSCATDDTSEPPGSSIPRFGVGSRKQKRTVPIWSMEVIPTLSPSLLVSKTR